MVKYIKDKFEGDFDWLVWFALMLHQPLLVINAKSILYI